MEYHKQIKEEDIKALVETYFNEYVVADNLKDPSTEEYKKIWNAAHAELTLRAILKAKGAKGFTTNFDDLGTNDINDPKFVGFDQIPGLASQRLMAEGYGFGAEGDWKSAALYRTVWVMSEGKGCSFLRTTLSTSTARTAQSSRRTCLRCAPHRRGETSSGSSLPRHRYPQEPHSTSRVHISSEPRHHCHSR